MTVKTKTLNFQTEGGKISYFEIAKDVQEFVDETGVKNGIVAIQSQHTTCAVFFEEMVHDFDERGHDALQVDLNNILTRLAPNQTRFTDYNYPGPKHREFASNFKEFNDDPTTLYNGPAHLKSTIIGASQTFVIIDGKVQKGEVGYIYFVDFDYCRPRKRKCHLCVIGE